MYNVAEQVSNSSGRGVHLPTVWVSKRNGIFNSILLTFRAFKERVSYCFWQFPFLPMDNFPENPPVCTNLVKSGTTLIDYTTLKQQGAFLEGSMSFTTLIDYTTLKRIPVCICMAL